MTVRTGDHVHLVNDPTVDLEIDSVARQGSASTWYSAHDRRGRHYYVDAELTVPHAKHRRDEPPAGTITGVLPHPTVWSAPVPWWRTEAAHHLACRLGDLWEQFIAVAAVVVLFVVGLAVVALVTAALWPIQPNVATGIGCLGLVLLGLGIYLLFTRQAAAP